MAFRREVGQKGQVVIPVDIRRMLGIKSGEYIVFELSGSSATIKAEQMPEKAIEEFVNVPKLKKKLSAKELKEVIMGEHEIS
jgi:AbrB family looped-hinge helix DNA binding protein